MSDEIQANDHGVIEVDKDDKAWRQHLEGKLCNRCLKELNVEGRGYLITHANDHVCNACIRPDEKYVRVA